MANHPQIVLTNFSIGEQKRKQLLSNFGIVEQEVEIQKSADVDEFDDALEKAEGARGGKVIGHTKSGKPIYENANHESHVDFTAQDHKEAKDLHEKKAYKHNETKNNAGASRSNRMKAAQKEIQHKDQADIHGQKSFELKKSNYNDALEKGFVSLLGEDILEKSHGKLNTSHLILKEIKPGIKRWVDPNKGDKEFAPEGHVAEFSHKGQAGFKGVVGRVHPKLGHYEIHGEDGKKYEKLPHHLDKVYDADKGEKPDLNEGQSIKDWAKVRSTPELIGVLADKKWHKDAKDAAKKVLEFRDKLPTEYATDVQNPGGSGGGSGSGSGGGSGAAPTEADIKEKLKAEHTAKEIEKNKHSEEDEKYKDSKFHKDINFRFQVYEDLVDDVINGSIRSLLVYGAGGVGKSFTVENSLQKEGKVEYDPNQHSKGSDDYDYVLLKGGKTTPTGLYAALYEHNGKLIIMDDNDNLLKIDDGINILKGATDTKNRKVSNTTGANIKDENGAPIPKEFKFGGKIIIISNMDTNEKKLQPIKSRASKIDMTMTPDQTIDRIVKIATDKGGKLTGLDFSNETGEKGKSFEYTHEDAQTALDFMREHKDEFGDDLSVRTMKTLITLKHRAEKRGADPEEYMLTHLLSKSNEDKLQKAFGSLLKGGVGSGRRKFKQDDDEEADEEKKRLVDENDIADKEFRKLHIN